MPEALNQLYLIATGNPLFLVCGLILVSWLWEDAAVIAAALFALDGQLPVVLAATASLIGITTGDMGLYLLGRAGHRWPKLTRRFTQNHRANAVQQRFQHRTLSNIFLIRFVPGLRTLGFTLCGLWKVPAQRFAVAMLVAGVVWVAFIFLVVNAFGLADFLKTSPWKWSLMAIALVLLLANNTLVPKLLARKSDTC